MDDEIRLLKAEIKRLRRSLSRLTPSLEVLLKRRGFVIYKKEPSDDLLLPEGSYLEDYIKKLNKYSFRLFLRDVIKHQDRFALPDVTRYATREVTQGYIEFLLKAGMIEGIGKETYRLRKRPIKSFGETLEWFIAQLINREFEAETVWGVKFRRPRVGGDYDLIAKFDSSILYMEIKSSPPKQIYDKEISSFLDRVDDLSPEISIFFVDTELRMKDKIVPMFEEELRRRQLSSMGVERLKKELFYIGRRIFIINSKGGIAENIKEVLSFYWHNRDGEAEEEVSDRETVEQCAICAWRADCQKKFSISGRDMRCPDFTRDVTLSRLSEEDSQPPQSPDTP
jgi:hypothetical protein